MPPWLQYLIAFVVGCHGVTYIIFGIVAPGTVKEWRGTSQMLGTVLTGEGLERAVLVLHVAAGIALLTCGVAIAFAASAPGWWRPLAVVGAASGLAGFVAFWDGQAHRVVEEGAIGAAISMVLLVSALALPNAFG